jgi:type IV secretory pathway VirB10-like protein
LVSELTYQEGAAFPAALITGIRSDLPGQITAQVTEISMTPQLAAPV